MSRAARHLLAALVAAAVLIALLPAAASAATRTYEPSRVTATTAVFRMPVSESRRIVRAYLRAGSRRRAVAGAAVRRSASRGAVRLRVPRTLRRSAGGRVARVRLVATLRTTFARPVNRTKTKRALEPAPSEPVAPTAPVAPAPTPLVTEWRPPGTPPVSDAQAAASVRPAAEIRPQNAVANSCTPSDEELATFHATRFTTGVNAGTLANQWMPNRRFVTGRFTGTTDEIFQWAAHKWGIPENLVRAVADTESDWFQSKMGDRNTVSDPTLYPVHSRISGNEVYESLGIMQIKHREGSLHPGTEPLRWRCTAFNVDYWAASVRFFYDGQAADWFEPGDGYGPGQAMESISAWFNPTPWHNSDATTYQGWVRDNLAARAWESPGW